LIPPRLKADNSYNTQGSVAMHLRGDGLMESLYCTFIAEYWHFEPVVTKLGGLLFQTTLYIGLLFTLELEAMVIMSSIKEFLELLCGWQIRWCMSF